jgi:hypothetical protein
LEKAMQVARQSPRKTDGKGGVQKLNILGVQDAYSLVDLGLFLKVKALPNTKVYFHAPDGGVFPNGLALCEVEADDQGSASVLWTSLGRGVGPCVVDVCAAGHVLDTSAFHIQIVKPMLVDLTEISGVATIKGAQLKQGVQQGENRLRKTPSIPAK